MKPKPSWKYWVLLILLTMWAIAMVWFYWMDRTLPDAQYAEMYGVDLMQMRSRVPLWATLSYGIGVWSALLGCLFMVFQKTWAYPVYIVSFLGATLAWVWNISDETGRINIANGGWVMLVIVLSVCLFQIRFAQRMKNNGTLT